MINWSFPKDLQEKYDKILADTRRLQKEFGIEPRTMEQRYQDYLNKKAAEALQQKELENLLQSRMNRRPIPKWKV